MDQSRLDDSIEIDEGYRPRPYRDTRELWTVADGRCLETAPLSGQEWKTLLDNGWIDVSVTHEGAKYLLHLREAQAVAALRALLPNWDTLGDVRHNALIEESYQLGSSFLSGWPNTLKLLRDGDFEGAAHAEELSEWARIQTPGRAHKLITAIRTNTWPT